LYQNLSLHLVEARGIELLSERVPTRASTSVDCSLEFRPSLRLQPGSAVSYLDWSPLWLSRSHHRAAC